MIAIREIKKVKNSKIEINLSKDYNGEEVEVIVLLENVNNKVSNANRKKAIDKYGGVFNKFANPDLIKNEKEIAWSKVADKKR